MNLTVEQALSVYPLSEAKLVAGFAGVNRMIRAVNVMDAPDITDWIKEGELVFTTAYLVKDRPDEASRLIRKLDERRSSGLGIKLGRFWEAIPELLIEQANRLGFPLIELPYEFTFSDQMNGLFREEMKRSNGLLQETLDKQIRLARFALRTDPSRRLFDAMIEVLGHPIAAIGARGQVVHNSSAIPEEELLGNWPWPQRRQWVKGDGWQAFRIPLTRQSECTGYALFFNARPILSAVEEGLYLQAADLMAFHLNFTYEDYFELSVQRDFDRLVTMHLSNGLPAATLTEYAARWDAELFLQPYRVAWTGLSGSKASERNAETLERLQADLKRHGGIQKLKGLHVAMEEGVLSVFPESGGGSGDAAADAFDAFFADMHGASGAIRTVIGSRKLSADQLKEAYSECRESLRLSNEWGVGDRVVRQETLDLTFLFERVPPERMRAFCDRWLGGLQSRDADYVREMLRTLETYLDCDGQLNETAKKLFIHRNTAAYRIEKLSEMLDVDFKKVNDLLRLKIAFLFRRMLNLD